VEVEQYTEKNIPKQKNYFATDIFKLKTFLKKFLLVLKLRFTKVKKKLSHLIT
jgi:hypothetical protein